MTAVPLTPSAFLESLAARIDRLHEGTAGVLLLAVPVKAPGHSKVYGGFVYASLRDARTGDVIDARVPEGIAASLPWNCEAVFAGLIRFKPGRSGTVRPEFRVDSIQEAGSLHLPSKDELLQRWSDAAARPKRDLRAALQGSAPKVTIITGVGSVAVDDIRAQLKELEPDVALTVLRVPITKPEEVVKALRETADAQLVVLTRGGGEGLSLLDDEALIAAVAACPVPVAVALGHATDDLILGRVADASFPTPTAFGAWLRGILKEKRDQAQGAAEAQRISTAQDLLSRLEALHASVARWRAAALGAALLAAAAVIWVLMGK